MMHHIVRVRCDQCRQVIAETRETKTAEEQAKERWRLDRQLKEMGIRIHHHHRGETEYFHPGCES